MEMVLPEFYGLKTRHRICPICEGEGMVTVPSFSRDIPPDADDCPICEGLGRVDQLGWVRATLLNIDERIGDASFEQSEMRYYMSYYADPFYIIRFGFDGGPPTTAKLREWYEAANRNMRELKDRRARLVAEHFDYIEVPA